VATFNVAPDERDVFNVEAMLGQTHFTPEEHRAPADLVDFGLVDVFRLHHGEGKKFTWWDYAPAASNGTSPQNRFHSRNAAPGGSLHGSRHRRRSAKRDKPSDHAPVIATFRQRNARAIFSARSRSANRRSDRDPATAVI